MKKFLSGLIAALLLTAGFVALSGQGAQAAPSRGCTQYTPVCGATSISGVGSKASKRVAPTVKVTVKSSGSIVPKGTVTLTFKGKSYNKSYAGKPVTFKLPKQKPGKYKVALAYAPASSSPTKPSKGSATFVVKR